MWAATAASYCPSRAGELPKQNMMKSHKRWDGKLCIKFSCICQIIFMGVWPNAVGIFGALLVLASVVGIALEERYLSNNSSSSSSNNQVTTGAQDHVEPA